MPPARNLDAILTAAQSGDALAAYIYGLETWPLRSWAEGSGRILCDELRACLQEAWAAWERRKGIAHA